MAQDIVRTASRHLEAEDELPPPKPELPTPKPEPTKAKPKPSPPKPPSPPPKKLAWGQLRLVLRLVSSHGKGNRRKLRKHPDPEDVRRVLRLVQERYPETNFHGNPGATGLVCRAFIGTALRRHRPPWHLRDGQSLDLVQAYMDIKGIKDRRAACAGAGAARGGAPTRTRPRHPRRGRVAAALVGQLAPRDLNLPSPSPRRGRAAGIAVAVGRHRRVGEVAWR